MKTQEEKLTLEQVNNLPKVETLSKILYELTDDELKQVTGGMTEQELIEVAELAQIDITKNDKNQLIEDMEQIIELSNKILDVES